MKMELNQLNSLSTVSHSISSLLSSPSPPQSIYIQSSSNTDITLQLISQIFQNQLHHSSDLLPRFVQINLDEILSSRNLFQSILNHLANWHPPYHLSHIQSWNGQTCKTLEHPGNHNSSIWDYPQLARVNDQPQSKGLLAQRKSSSFDGFCDGLRIICNELLSPPHSELGPRFIILNRPEFLRSWKDFNFLTSFTRLAELSGCSVHTIFVSPLPWHKLRPRYGAIDPISISIPRLSDADLIKVLINDGPPDVETQISTELLKNQMKQVFEAFVSFVVATFNSQTSADLYELSVLVNRLWPDWIARMDEREFLASDMAKMILLFKPIIELEQKSYGSPVWHLPSFLTKPAGLDMDLNNGEEDDDNGDDDDDADAATIVGSPEKKKRKNLNDELDSPKKSDINPLLLSPTKTRIQQIIQSPFTTPSKPRHYYAFLSPSVATPSSQPGSLASTRHQFTNHLTPTTPRIVQSNHLKFNSSTNNKAPAMYQRQKTLDILSLSLPVVSRFLIVAAFIASFNPNRSDLILFLTSNSDSIKKRRSRAAKKTQPGQVIRAKIRQRLLGPKTFTVGRLLAIFHAITDQEGVKFDQIDVLQQVGTLIQFKLLLRTGIRTTSSSSNENKNLESIKLIISNLSCFNQSQILNISDSLNFNLLNRMFESED